MVTNDKTNSAVLGPSKDTEDLVNANKGLYVLDFILFLGRHKRMLIGVTSFACLLAAGILFLMPNVYTATPRILPPQQGLSTMSSLVGQLSNLSGISQGALPVKNPGDLFVGMLRSRTILDSLVLDHDLRHVYGESTV